MGLQVIPVTLLSFFIKKIEALRGNDLGLFLSVLMALFLFQKKSRRKRKK
jgi:hypothetical protein